MNNDQTPELLREVVRWLRFQSIDKAKKATEDLLDSDQKRVVFQMSDGLSSARSVALKAGVSNVTVSRWWDDWFSAGILFEENNTYKKLFSLSDLGIETLNGISKRSATSGGSAKKVKI
jgi:hypothetical protein